MLAGVLIRELVCLIKSIDYNDFLFQDIDARSAVGRVFYWRKWRRLESAQLRND